MAFETAMAHRVRAAAAAAAQAVQARALLQLLASSSASAGQHQHPQPEATDTRRASADASWADCIHSMHKYRQRAGECMRHTAPTCASMRPQPPPCFPRPAPSPYARPGSIRPGQARRGQGLLPCSRQAPYPPLLTPSLAAPPPPAHAPAHSLPCPSRATWHGRLLARGVQRTARGRHATSGSACGPARTA